MVETKSCIVCKQDFLRKGRSSKKWEVAKFCSVACKGKSMEGNIPHNKGKSPSEDTRMKISKNHADVSGENNPMYGRSGEQSPLFGKKQPQEWQEKKSKSLMTNGNFKPPQMFGNTNPNWIDGRTPVRKQIRDCAKYTEWRLMVFGRDNYTCQECGKRSTYFEAHHKKLFSDILEEFNITTLEQALLCDSLWEIDNGITYCKECHDKITFN
jgi:hypothetical protein